jgi:hypothetical protein
LPWNRATLFGAPFYSAEGEAKRVAVNRWIRQNTVTPWVVDFEAAVRDPADPTALAASYDLGDHLHCNDAGLAGMANAVDLEMLR